MTENWDDGFICPVCHTDQFVPMGGNENSPVMIIGEFPGDEEIERGIPMIGRMGGVLKSELQHLGVGLYSLHLANLWFHAPRKKDDPLYKDCLAFSAGSVIKAAKDKKAVLLIGSDTVEFFCHKKVSNVNGLQVQATYLSAPIIYACVQPATVFHSSIGELRLSLSKFIKRLEIEGIFGEI